MNSNLTNTPNKIHDNFHYNSNSNFSDEKSLRYAVKYPETRLFSESKRNRLNDMKRNVCDRMMDRIIQHRKNRIDNILYSKSHIIRICQDEYYDVILLKNRQ